jgi:hypothetical protein
MERRNNMKDSQVKKIITESVLGFLNEARHSPNHKNEPDKEYLDKQYGGEGGGTHLSPWINKGKSKNTGPYIHPSYSKPFRPNPPSLNEEQLQEIEEIYKELTRK